MNARMRPVRTGLVATAAVLAAGALITGGIRQHASSQEPPPPRTEIPVRTATVGAWTDAAGNGSISGTGTLEARRRATLAFAVGGVVDRVHVEDGDRADHRSPLVALDATPFRAARDEAAAQIAFLEARLERSRALLEENAVSQEEFDADRAELAALRARLRQAEWNVGRAILRAPFPGLVESRGVELGQVVAPGTPAVTLIDVDTLEVQVPIAARDLGAVTAGMAVTVTVADDGHRSVTGFVHHEPVVSDPRAGTVSLSVWVPNLDRAFLPGLLARCEITAPPSTDGPADGPTDAPSRLAVPLSAVRLAADGAVVFRLVVGADDTTTVERVRITTGPARDDVIEVLSGLSPDDVIVVSIPDRLQDGDRVRAVEGA